MATEHNLTIEQGKTFIQVVRWETEPLLWKPITGVSQAAPAVVTAVGHGIPDGWPVVVASVQGMTEINAAHNPPRATEWHKAYVVDDDTVKLPDVNASEFTPYESGGYLMLYSPVDLVGYTARMEIKDKVGGEILATFTSAAELVLDTAAHTTTLTIAADDTAAYDWRRGVYDLELVSPDGVVTAVIAGKVTVSKEVTT